MDLNNDIIKSLSDSYNKQIDYSFYKNELSNTYNFFKNKKDGSMREKLQNELNDPYIQQLSNLERLKKEEFDFRAQINREMIKNNSFARKLEEQSHTQRLNQYKNEIDLLNKHNDDKYSKIAKEEENIYKQILKQNGNATDDQLSNLRALKKKEKEIEKDSFIYKQEQFNKYMDEQEKRQKDRSEKIKEAGVKLGKKIVEELEKAFDYFVTDRVKKGFSDLSSAYEQNFTSIAAYSGSTSRQANHDFIKSVLTEVTSSDALKRGLNFSSDVFPEITNAVKEGFIGDNARNIAITNAVDKKIMPWLETSSETWTQFQFDLSSERIQQLKGQQLLLQESKEGNRLLQSGVISQIQNILAPSLDNIVANTTEVEDLNIQAQQEFLYLTQDMNYSKQDAMKLIQKQLNAYQNPFESLQSQDLATRLYAMDGLNGTDMAGQFISTLVGSGYMGAGVAKLYGFEMGGETRSERGILANANLKEGSQKYANVVGKGLTSEELEKIYQQNVANLPEDTTATAAYDNDKENYWASFGFDANNMAHGADIQGQILDNVIDIKKWLFDLLAIQLGNVLGNVFTKGEGLVSKLLTGGNSLVDAIGIGSGKAGRLALGEGLKTGGLIGGLTQGGSAMTGGAISGMGATAVGTGTLIAGTALIGKGISTGIDTAKNWDKSSTGDKVAGTLGTAGMVGGGAAATLAALGMVSGPIGWAGLAIGGIAMLGKAAYDNATALSGNAKKVDEAFESIKDSIHEENKTRVKMLSNLKTDMRETNDTNEKKKIVISTGLLTEEDLKNKSNVNLDNLVNAYVRAATGLNDTTDEVINAIKARIVNEQDTQTKDFIEELVADTNLKHTDAIISEKEKGILSVLMSSVTDQKTLNKYNDAQNDKKITYGEYRDLLYGGIDGMFGWDKANLSDVGLNVNDMKTTQDLYGVAKNITFIEENDKTIAKSKDAMDAFNNVMLNVRAYNDEKLTESDKEIAKNKVIKSYNDVRSNEYLKEIISSNDEFKTKFNAIANNFNLEKFRLGSSFIPTDMMAILHKGERVLTANQNKEFTENNLAGNNSGIIRESVRDIVVAIQQQTQDIIMTIRSLKLDSNTSTSKLNMSPIMGNTRVIL